MSVSGKKLKAFIPTTNFVAAKEFYGNTLGLTLLSADDFGLEFLAGEANLRITLVKEFNPHPFTVLGWETDDIVSTVQELKKKGVIFMMIGDPAQDNRGIWTAPGGTKVAWFRDPDGNVLSVSGE